MDMNTFVGEPETDPRGARYGASATLRSRTTRLASDATGAVSGGGGFADSYYQPLILGWEKTRVALKAIYELSRPDDDSRRATDNVGSGYWTQRGSPDRAST
jgi:hypothetical protein